MKEHLRPAVVSLAFFTLLTGIAYPVAVTVLAKLLWPRQASGSVVVKGDRAVGSDLIGQPFDHPAYFWSRLSATGPDAYTAFNGEKATGSGGSNYGPLNPALKEAAEARAKALREADPALKGPIPGDLLTASGSGLDPHVSPAGAEVQVARVAKARGAPEKDVRELVAAHSEPRRWGMLGEPAVNVLRLNLALDERFGTPKAR